MQQGGVRGARERAVARGQPPTAHGTAHNTAWRASARGDMESERERTSGRLSEATGASTLRLGNC